MTTLTRENVRAFLDRDWAASRRSKDKAIGRHVKAHGTHAAFALAQTLLNAVWPRINEHREADLEAHLELRRKLEKTNPRRR